MGKEKTNDQSPEDDSTLENESGSAGTELLLPDAALPDKLYLIPAGNRPFFPAQVQPLIFAADVWQETLKRVVQSEQAVLGLSFIDSLAELDEATIDQFPEIGCAVKIHNLITVDDHIQFVALGVQRFKITKWLRRSPPYLAQVSYPASLPEDADTLRAYAMALVNAIKELLPLNPLYSEELKHYLHRFSPRDPSPLADFAAAITTAKGVELQEVLDTISVQRRMEKVLVLVRKEQEVAKLQGEISEAVNMKISKHQREFFLKEQLKVIQRELGISKDDKTAEIEEFEERLKGKAVPPEVQKKIDAELHKLRILEMGSPEFSVTRNLLDWITSVPWGVTSDDTLDIDHARMVLDEDHSGLNDVKDRIIEFLAVGIYKGAISGSVMLLVGPPGVGKTSIGASIARALGRKFYRFSLGGMTDESEIKGHRRTYIGSMPGKIVQALKEVEVMNPVIMLDEIDKVGTSYHGDPASALLEVLDPSQNEDFLDHYIDMRVDLSQVLFVCTANQTDSIPNPLFDRMECVRLSGYITYEKILIAKNHLWPKQLEKAGMKKNKILLNDDTLRMVIEGYAREAGVRNLEKLLSKIIRKVAVKLIKKDKKSVSINSRNLVSYLGQPVFDKEKVLQGVGIVMGLAWTSMGGVTLCVEAQRIHNLRSGFKLTGQLGDVMKESATIAYSYIMKNAKRFKCPEGYFEKANIHLHVPEGATPKDGPSAGITMASALLSLACNKKPRMMAMTGELTLTGAVLAVGGIREKIIAARRSKCTEIILPNANKHDYEELPDYIKENMEIHFVKTFSAVAKILF